MPSMRIRMLLGGLQRFAICLLLTGLILPRPCAALGPPPVITVQPSSITVLFQGTANFSVTASSETSMSYQWYFNGTDISGANSSTYTISDVQAADAGLYSVQIVNGGGSVTSSSATLTVNVPVTITSQPQNQTVTQGQGAMFSVTAAGSTPLGYQWYFNGSAISGATSSSLTLSDVQAAQAGSYTVIVSNLVGSITSAAATLTVNLPPSIATQPQSQSVLAGGSASFTVVASGTGTLKYQWYKNGSSARGNIATYNINNVKMDDAGNYLVIITNNYGSATSAVATLMVNGTLTITNQPQNLTVTQGQNAVFSVTAGGTTPLGYQWYFNSSALSGATSSTLILTNVQTNQAGSYAVVVSNVVGSITSAVATLVVYVPPGIVAQPQSQTVVAGQNVTISVAASGTAPLGCQWYFNGTALTAPANWSPTNWTLTLSNVQTGIAGTYSAVVTNLAGSITSEPATLTVTNPDIVLSVPAGAGMDTNGFTFQLSVPGGGTYVILASADLQSWTPITTNAATNTTVVFTDADAANYSNRFYQAVVTTPGS